jgi:hypothetical protein
VCVCMSVYVRDCGAYRSLSWIRAKRPRKNMQRGIVAIRGVQTGKGRDRVKRDREA